MIGQLDPSDLLTEVHWGALEQYEEAMLACGFGDENIRGAMQDLHASLLQAGLGQYDATIQAWGQAVRDVCETGQHEGITPTWAPDEAGDSPSSSSSSSVSSLAVGAGVGAASVGLIGAVVGAVSARRSGRGAMIGGAMGAGLGALGGSAAAYFMGERGS